MSKKDIMQYLTEAELNAALAKAEPLHIGIMTSRKEDIKNDGVTRV